MAVLVMANQPHATTNTPTRFTSPRRRHTGRRTPRPSDLDAEFNRIADRYQRLFKALLQKRNHKHGSGLAASIGRLSAMGRDCHTTVTDHWITTHITAYCVYGTRTVSRKLAWAIVANGRALRKALDQTQIEEAAS